MKKIYRTKAEKFECLYDWYLTDFKYQNAFCNINGSVYENMNKDEQIIMDTFFSKYMNEVNDDRFNIVRGNQNKYEVLIDETVDFIKSIYSKYIQKDGIIKRPYEEPIQYGDFIKNFNTRVDELKNILELKEACYNVGKKITIGDVELTKIKTELDNRGLIKNRIYGNQVSVHYSLIPELEDYPYSFLDLLHAEDVEDGLYIANNGLRVDIEDDNFTFYSKDKEEHPLYQHLQKVLRKYACED